jgi:hypothetical protein
MTVTRAIRWSFRLFPNFREHSNTGFKVSSRNIFDQFRSQIVSGIENLFEDRFRAALQMDSLAAAVVLGIAAFHPAIIFQAVEQAGEGGAFNPHSLGDFFLGQFIPAIRKMHQRPPFSLAQAKRAQTLVELCPPRPRRPKKDKSKFAEIRCRHELRAGIG